jgi:hypothetical protein
MSVSEMNCTGFVAIQRNGNARENNHSTPTAAATKRPHRNQYGVDLVDQASIARIAYCSELSTQQMG